MLGDHLAERQAFGEPAPGAWQVTPLEANLTEGCHGPVRAASHADRGESLDRLFQERGRAVGIVLLQKGHPKPPQTPSDLPRPAELASRCEAFFDHRAR